MAQKSVATVVEGDLLIIGTHGVFDNLFDCDFCDIASLALSPSESLIVVVKEGETYLEEIKRMDLPPEKIAHLHMFSDHLLAGRHGTSNSSS
ncbi:unnamed protein product [Vitrella brassicaformis CCMP3155]|uniref:Uncharacterized protein n=1 Tax=Vitrella brassicaformis (strain CCMP3155) TaxID=1169540 RepID=A0A0G4FY53_VITBC|nr:unnamed protein product [Vitrella brassicaformis CCMP3155]|eukprot:CEM20274.1 unnamed protein product [Vitrella brassicaformis CCMP3155]